MSPEDGEESTSESTPASESEFPTLELTLEEARRRYDDEKARRSAVESKIGTVVTIDALIIAVVGVFSDIGWVLGVAIVLALLSAGIGLWALRTRNYERPGKDIDDFHEYAGMTIEEQQRQLLTDYIVAIDGDMDEIEGNHAHTDEKYNKYDVCVLLTGISFGIILLAPVIEYFGCL
jgi:hypothetical protein